MKEETKLIVAGRPHRRPAHPVNHPVERASTYLFPSYDDFLEGAKNITYGRLGTANHRALEETVNLLEGGYETRLAPSGLQAIVASVLAFCQAGDQVLVSDAVYDPTRKFCDRFLKRFGVEPIYYPPLIGEDLADLVTERTKVILAESPGSLTFEVQDLPALALVARKTGARLVVDNTWSAGVYCKPIALGAAVSVQAGTKYLVGHADCLIGSIASADEETARAVFHALLQLGANVSADDAWLALRGARTLAARLARHQETGLKLAKWLSRRPEVERVLHPALKSCPGHAIWKRDFTGASGLFGVVLKPVGLPALKAFFNALKLFGMGFSWGGFESLCVHVHPERYRTAEPWTEECPVIRIHAGLEDADDLIADLERGFSAMAAAKT
ncbi:cystathionine beta-lyase [Amphiplicatus metriothermophilus]|uniref:Cystathionine beta-lyase n=1 Tax=Amphiplicatus metriothermophilus TaxID=1519374 RepID=A0A239PSM0_9PROT|nr:cystathionine beta-lyase [Amphiplicatus metriothermophilus]MBB5519206.1 cystathionine beta-lyase [Amphiplicatus metriothermophilus]SNT73275.1 cystathionine beta-lyase [Amphiplicatus metriothermophilus]